MVKKCWARTLWLDAPDDFIEMYWCIPVFSFWQTKWIIPAFSYQVITKVHRSRGYFWNHGFTVWGILISVLNKIEAPERIKLSHNVDCFLAQRGEEWNVPDIYFNHGDEAWLIQANSENCDPLKKGGGGEGINFGHTLYMYNPIKG